MPDVALTDTQWRLLAQLVAAALPDSGSGGRQHARAIAARGLDPDQVYVDVPVLTWLRLLEQRDDWLVVTDLGTAVHYRRVAEACELRLSDVARFAEAGEAAAPHFARTVRRLAQGSLSLAEALGSLPA
ncbi:hypothetical protein [Streptomyces sp. 2131.1]|uniref:hypothetical protein n=1 Tax=Streptomyces sp. 2131.1 TaxID=1855346 RepID=UPI000B8365AC|nr:hypothetical protein [Streptomyces sp. 2131.1]